MASKPIIYGTAISPPCRAVWMTAAALGLEIEHREINMMNQDHMKEDYMKMNPQHTVPTMNDNGFCIWDSHAIACYLVSKYGKDDKLYPKDPQKRAVVDQRLHFDCGTLFATLREICRPIFRDIKNTIPDSDIDRIREVYDFLNKFLAGRQWLAGTDSYTVADICCAANISSTSVLLATDNYPNIKAWMKRCEQQLPGYKEWNKPGNDLFSYVFLGKLKDEKKYPMK